MSRRPRPGSLAALPVVAAFAVAAPTAAAAAAAEWWYVADSKDSVVFVDRASTVPARAAGRSAVRAWFASYESAPRRDGVKSSKTQVFVDCQDRSIAYRSYIGYGADGSVKVQDSENEYLMDWRPVAPGTIGEAQVVFACNARQIADDVTEFEAEGLSFFHVEDLDSAAKRLTPKPPRVSPNSAGKRG